MGRARHKQEDGKKEEFIILGPTFGPGHNVLAAIHSLYYLPENYKLVFIGAEAVGAKFYNEVMALVERDELDARVAFASAPTRSNAVILPHPHKSRAYNSVTGDSPEALASAILNIARAA